MYRDIGEFSPAEAIQHPNVEKTHDANVEYADILGPSSQVVPSVKIHELSPLNESESPRKALRTSSSTHGEPRRRWRVFRRTPLCLGGREIPFSRLPYVHREIKQFA